MTAATAAGATDAAAAPTAGAVDQRQLKVEDALQYLDRVKSKFAKTPHIYNEFLGIMRQFKSRTIDTPGVIEHVARLFKGSKDLVLGFNAFLPPGYKIEFASDDGSVRYGQGLMTPQLTQPGGGAVGGMSAEMQQQAQQQQQVQYQQQAQMQQALQQQQQAQQMQHMQAQHMHAAAQMDAQQQQQQMSQQMQMQQQMYEARQMQEAQLEMQQMRQQMGAQMGQQLGMGQYNQQQMQQQQMEMMVHHNGAMGSYAEQQTQPPPPAFDHAISYVTKIRSRFRDDDRGNGTYKTFLEILHTYQEGVNTIKTVLDKVATLFKDHPDLLREFTYFLPESAQPEAQQVLEKHARRSEMAMASRDYRGEAYGGYGGGMQHGRRGGMHGGPALDPRESHFFRDMKATLGGGSRTASSKWDEFLKCLTLYAREVLSKPEMLSLVRDLLQDATADTFDYGEDGTGSGGRANELIERFKDILSQRGILPNPLEHAWFTPKVTIEMLLKANACTPSFRELPEDHGVTPCSGRSAKDQSVLNDLWVSIPTGSEDSTFARQMRKNIHEEALWKVEDERFECDMVIDANDATIAVLEPLVAEAERLRRKNESVAWQFRLDRRSLSTTHMKAIARIYGDQGNEVLELLRRSPAAALPIILRRLKQKAVEWTAARKDNALKWRSTVGANYPKSLDHRAFYFKQLDKKRLTAKSLVKETREVTSIAAAGAPRNSGVVKLDFRSASNAKKSGALDDSLAAHLHSCVFAVLASFASKLDETLDADLLNLRARRAVQSANASAKVRKRRRGSADDESESSAAADAQSAASSSSTLLSEPSSAATTSVRRVLLDYVFPLQRSSLAATTSADFVQFVQPLTLPAAPFPNGSRVKTPMGNGRVLSFRELSVKEAGTVPMGGCYEVELIQDGGCALARGLSASSNAKSSSSSGKAKGSKKRGRSVSAADAAEAVAKVAKAEEKITGWARGFFSRGVVTLRDPVTGGAVGSKGDAYSAAARRTITDEIASRAAVQAANVITSDDDADETTKKMHQHCAGGTGCTSSYDSFFGNDTTLCVMRLHQVRRCLLFSPARSTFAVFCPFSFSLSPFLVSSYVSSPRDPAPPLSLSPLSVSL